uniref:TF-B3 domain-containing protein n=1 Tax=Fagus sylvatica TaxID=28930 RepID=A0A2N9FQS4_FAGSY
MTFQCQKNGENVPADLMAKPPHFFKIILADTLRQGKLRIPRKFISIYGGGLSNIAFLKLPNGAEWKVELSKGDGEVWLQKGWDEFAKHNSINVGRLLVFRYEGNSHFYVLVFDQSATEIDYPFNEKPQVPEMESIESDDNSVEIIDDFKPSRKTREKSPCPCVQPHKRTKTNPSSFDLQPGDPHFRPEVTESKVLENSKMNAGPLTAPNIAAKECIAVAKRCPKSEVIERMHRLSTSEKDRALHRARAFESKNPFLMIVMQPSYIHPGKTLVAIFRDAKDTKCPPWNGSAQESDCSMDNVSCPHDQYPAKEGGGGTSTTWRCLKAKAKKQDLTTNGTSRNLLRASAFKSENPFFMIMMQPAYICGKGIKSVPSDIMNYLPKKGFTKKDTIGHVLTVMLQVADRLWPVKLYSYSYSSYKFSAGWTAFSTVDTSGRTSAAASAGKSEVMEKTRQITYQSDAALFIVFPKRPAQFSMAETPHCPVVTVDTTTKLSTAASNVTRNHEKDKRGAEKVEEVAMAPQVSTIQGQRPPQPSTPVVLTHLQHGAKEERADFVRLSQSFPHEYRGSVDQKKRGKHHQPSVVDTLDLVFAPGLLVL